MHLEEQILRRARGAFLVHWFGTSVPVRGLGLHIVIGNVAALKRRYLQAKRSMPGAAPELNLIGPLSAIGGVMLGMAMSPTGAILIAMQTLRIANYLADEGMVGSDTAGILAMLYRVIGIWVLPALGPALGVLAVPLLLVGALGAALGGSRTARGVYEALGEVAGLIDVVVRFWDMLSGPRSEIRNPLLRRVLTLLDRFAGLFVQVLGFGALLVTRIAPLVPHLMAQFRALAGLLGAVMDALMGIFDSIGTQLGEAFTGRPNLLTILERVLDSILALPTTMMERINELVDDVTLTLAAAFDTISARIGTFADGLTKRLKGAFGQTAVGLLLAQIDRLLKIMPAVSEAFAQAPDVPEEEKDDGPIDFGLIAGALTGGFTGSLADLLNSLGTIPLPGAPELALPDFPATPTLPDLKQLQDAVGRPAGLDMAALTAEANALVATSGVPADLLRRPPSAFRAERRELMNTLGRPRLDLGDERLRDLIYLAVGRVLPPSLRTSARAGFDALDEELYGIEREPLAETQLDLADSGRLRPVVSQLTIRSIGGFAPDVRAFRDVLVEAIRGRTYVAPQAG